MPTGRRRGRRAAHRAGSRGTARCRAASARARRSRARDGRCSCRADALSPVRRRWMTTARGPRPRRRGRRRGSSRSRRCAASRRTGRRRAAGTRRRRPARTPRGTIAATIAVATPGSTPPKKNTSSAVDGDRPPVGERCAQAESASASTGAAVLEHDQRRREPQRQDHRQREHGGEQHRRLDLAGREQRLVELDACPTSTSSSLPPSTSDVASTASAMPTTA